VNCTNIFKSTILTDPGTALQENNRSEALIAELGGADWGWRLASLVAHGSLGNTSELREGFPDFDELTRRTRSDGGLPDNLLPLVTLAWRLGDTGRAQRWLTAIREAPAPTQNFNLTAVFRQLRSELGLTSDNPLDGASIEEIYAEARHWLNDLDADSNRGRGDGPPFGR
jgi:hypothetical protein